MNIDFSHFYECISPAFWDFFESKANIRVLYGGAGSSKSYTEVLDIVYKLIAEPGHNFIACRKVGRSNKDSTFSLIRQILSEHGLTELFKINMTDLSFVCKTNNNELRCKGLDDIEKLKSITFPNGVLTDIWVEEASEIKKHDLDQLLIRLRGRAKHPFQVTLTFNPISELHWLKKYFFDIKAYQKEHSVYILHSTYKDNLFINEDYYKTLEGLKHTDPEYYRVYCLGEWGHFGNIIFNNWTFNKCPYKESDFDAIYSGLDFGFTHPQVIEKVGFKDGVMYSYDELCFSEKTNAQFIELNEEYEVLDKNQRCTADSAEPSKIKEWQQKGYSVVGAIKGPDSVTRGIDYMKNLKWVIDDEKCPRLAQEVQMYHWKEDKHGEPIDRKPTDIFDDAIKSIMYALEDLSRMKGKPGVLSGTKSDIKKSLIEAKKEVRRQKREVLKAQVKKRREKTEK